MPSQGHSAKYFKNKKNFFAERQIWDARQRILKKIKSLPSARSGALGKEFKKNQIFAECLTAGARQRRPWPNAVSRAAYAECRDFAESLALGKEVLCRVPVFAEFPALGKEIFAECNSLPSARFFTLGKEFCTRQSLCFQ